MHTVLDEENKTKQKNNIGWTLDRLEMHILKTVKNLILLYGSFQGDSLSVQQALVSVPTVCLGIGCFLRVKTTINLFFFSVSPLFKLFHEAVT